jgi:cysteine desulfurase/selenocysteine lyase
VTGVVQPVEALCAMARSHGALSVVDAAQSVPHMPTDVARLGCDFLTFSGHKMLAPTGVGVLFGRPGELEKLKPLAVGGGAVDRVDLTGFSLKRSPYRFEAGTPNVSGVLGLAAAVDYLDRIGPGTLAEHERRLADELARQVEPLKDVRVLMSAQAPRLAIATVAPLARWLNADHLALMLSDSYQTMVRSGYHCAHPLFDLLGLQNGSIRASAYLYNTVQEIAHFGQALRAVLERLAPARGAG